MKRAAELTVFAGLAALIHIALFVRAPESGVQSSGSGGEALVSIQASNATVAEMVEAWERPRHMPAQIEAEPAELLPGTASPLLPEIELAQAPRTAVQIALSKPEETDVLNVDAAPPASPEPEPAPASKPEPEPAPEPQARPEPAPQPEAPKAAQTSPGQGEQRAAGSGGGSSAGQAGSASEATANSGRQTKLRNVWGAKIRARVERRKKYPSGATGKGTVVVRITVSRAGQLIRSRIAKSSGNATFDQAALKAIARAGTFPAAPKKLQSAQITVNLPITFSKR